MSWRDFETRCCGKWVLAGEHAVLRGATAIALPLKEKELHLSFRPGGSELLIEPAEAAPVLHDLLQALEDAWQAEDKSFPRPKGRLTIQSSIPIGAGMGSSAALCVALARWLREPLSLRPEELFEFAQRLEHRFHGNSSGMDIAAILEGKAISFVRGRGPTALGVRTLPRFTFHDTGLRAKTSDCILRVEGLHKEKPAFAMQIDESMSAASRQAMEGLIQFDSGRTEEALRNLAEAMRRAQECFYDWRLVPAEAKHLEDQLLRDGALAVKLTGAGGGGMLVALWR